MDGYFDIHSHVLPGIDDGAKNIEESKKMLYTAYENGIRNIIATPHYREGRYTASKEEINLAFKDVNELIQDEGLDITLYLGNEIYYNHNISSLLLNNKIFTMAGSNYVLLEFSPMISYQDMRMALQDIIMSGYWPILAHFERYINVNNKDSNIDEIYNMGVCIQVNASTITGSIFSKSGKLAKKLLKYDMIDFIATDSHNNNIRAPKLNDTVGYLKKKYGQDLVDKLLYVNPMKIINNEEI